MCMCVEAVCSVVQVHLLMTRGQLLKTAVMQYQMTAQ